MTNETLQNICNAIVLVGAVLLAIERIYRYIKKPVDMVKEKTEEQITEIVDEGIASKIPPIINSTAEALRCERQAEHDALIEKFDALVEERITPYFEEIERINLNQSEAIEILTQSTQDILRQDIHKIYDAHRKDKTLTQTEREVLDDLYRDYKKEKGNGIVEKRYNRMVLWDVVDDED